MALGVGIEVTRGCNFKCTHCFVDAGRRRSYEMTTTEIGSLLQALAEAGADFVGWSGGEPLIRRDLEEMTHRCKSLGLAVGLATNGFLASLERLTSLQRCGLQTIQVSLDAATADRAERFRKGPKGAFDRAVAAVESSVSLGLDAVVCSLFSPMTAADIEEMIAFSQKLGARTLRYTMWDPVGRAQGHYDEKDWGSPSVRRFLSIAEEYRHSEEFQVILDCPTGPLPGQRRFSCEAGRSVVYVTADGNLYPCTALMTPEFCAGNVLREPAGKLLQNSGMKKVHRQLRRMPGGACAACGIVDVCHGGCPGRTLAAFGSVRRGEHAGESPACMHRLHDPRHVGPRVSSR